MAADGHEATLISVSDNDRLIAVLQSCFSELITNQEEHAARLHRAVEALKPPAPAADKKSEFWNAYMKLADEDDKEFQKKYSTDLDTALIFAGLFSAVSSAFIIQVQPQLVSNAPPVIVVTQSLLYISLFTTLLAALLAVLGKQWIMYYQAAGSRGTIEERGLERQRKLDGLRRWKFDLVLQMFPLLLQFALLAFSSALSVYLWNIHRLVAIIVLALTLFGVTSYIFFLVTAIISPDCPFQMPLAPVLARALPPIWRILKSIIITLGDPPRRGWSSCSRFVKSRMRKHILPHFTSLASPVSPADPLSSDPHYDHYNYYVSPPSVEVPAVLWVLETSSDPAMITASAAMAVDLQWPLTLDPIPSMTRFYDTFSSCFDIVPQGPQLLRKVRVGMANRAISCGRAYCSLRHIASVRHQEYPIPWALLEPIKGAHDDHPQWTEMLELFRIIDMQPVLMNDSTVIKWVLHVIPILIAKHKFNSPENALEHFLSQFPEDKLPGLDHSGFANYLCCLNSCFGPMSPGIMAQIDKRRLQPVFMAQLLKSLRSGTIGTALVARILRTTAQLQLVGQREIGRTGWTVISDFCCAFPRVHGWLDVVVSAATLARVDDLSMDLQDGPYFPQAKPQEVEWLYIALEHLQRLWEQNRTDCQDLEWDRNTAQEIQSLLQILARSDTKSHTPPLESFHIILQALSAPGDISLSSFQILNRARPWFLDPNLGLIMRQSSVWKHLGRIALKYPMLAGNYFEIGKSIAETSEWKIAMFEELSTWITLFSGHEWGRNFYSNDIFISVIRSIWAPDFGEHHTFTNETEKTWVFALLALSNVWRDSDVLPPSWHEVIQLVRCTIFTSLRTNYCTRTVPYRIDLNKKIIPSTLRVTFSAQLGTSLTQAAGNIRKKISVMEVTRENENAGERMAEFLDVLGQKIGTDFEPQSGQVQLGGSAREYKDWTHLEKLFHSELDALEGMLNAHHVG